MARPHPPRRRSSRLSIPSSSTTLLTSSIILLTALSTSPSTNVLADNAHGRFAHYLPHWLQVTPLGDRPDGIQVKKPHGPPLIPVGAAGFGVGGGSGSGSGSGTGGGTGSAQDRQAVKGGKSPKGKQSPQQSAASPTSMTTGKSAEQGLDLQVFTGSLGGVKAPSITMSNVVGQPFMVEKATYRDFDLASEKACDIQRSMCQEIANREPGSGSQPTRTPKGKKGKRTGELVPNIPDVRGAFTANDCDSQRVRCEAAQKNAPFQTFNLDNLGADPLDPEFELLCMP